MSLEDLHSSYLTDGTVVFVLGAGFSRAISSTMPLTAELERTVRAANEAVGPVLDRLDNDIEQMLSHFADPPPWLEESEKLRARAVFTDVASAIAGRISADEDAVVNEADEPPDWLRSFADWCEAQGAGVITLNYDCLFESVWWSGPSNASKSGLYPVPLPLLATRDGSTVLAAQDFARCTVHKLHGSTRWFHDPADEGRGTVYQSFPKSWPGDYQYRDEHLRTGLHPLIVPPVATKNNEIAGRSLVRTTWTSAAEAIRSADVVAFLGYSLPQTDTMVASLFSQNLRNAALMVVDRSPETETRVRALYDTMARVSGDRLRKDAHPFISEIATTDPIPSFVARLVDHAPT